MFLPIKAQGTVRNTRVYGGSRAARSSKLSLISALSASSTESGGSTSTITQRSYAQTRNDSTRRKPRRRRSRGQDRHDPLSPGKAGCTDVFEYLIGDDVKGNIKGTSKPDEAKVASCSSADTCIVSDEASEPSNASRRKTALEGVTPQEDSDLEGYYRSHHSDSGISVASTMGDGLHVDTQGKSTLPPLIEEAVERRGSFTHSVYDRPTFNLDGNGGSMWQPVAGGLHDQIPGSPASFQSYSLPPSFLAKEENVVSNPESISFLASTPIMFRSKGKGALSQRQTYRSFTAVNSQLLLQMQAHIAELEEELHVADAKSLSIETPGSAILPQSKTAKRLMRYQTRRKELYQKLQLALDQYYQMLSATHQLQQISEPAKLQEITNRAHWLQEFASPEPKLSTLMGDRRDLIRLQAKPSSTSMTPRVVAIGTAINAFLPLVIFKILASPLNRLICVSLVDIVIMLVLDRSKITLEKSHWYCIGGMTGVSLLAAFIL